MKAATKSRTVQEFGRQHSNSMTNHNHTHFLLLNSTSRLHICNSCSLIDFFLRLFLQKKMITIIIINTVVENKYVSNDRWENCSQQHKVPKWHKLMCEAKITQKKLNLMKKKDTNRLLRLVGIHRNQLNNYKRLV